MEPLDDSNEGTSRISVGLTKTSPTPRVLPVVSPIGSLYCTAVVLSILITCKLDGTLTLPWVAVTVPIWVYHGIWLLYLIKYVETQKYETIHHLKQSCNSLVSSIVVFLLTLVFCAMLVAKLDGANLSWNEVFIPATIGLAGWVFINIWIVVTNCTALVLWIGYILVPLYALVQSVLIPVKISEEVEASWAVIMIPTWVATAVWLVAMLFMATMGIRGMYGWILIIKHAILWASFTSISIMIAIKLDTENDDLMWIYTIIPVLCACATLYIIDEPTGVLEERVELTSAVEHSGDDGASDDGMS